MKLMGIILVFWMLAGSHSACRQNDDVFTDEELMVKVPSSELYVRMRGNLNGPILVNLHGGPGGYSGIDIKLMGPGLEDRFLVAYLDQRGCGKSPGVADRSLLNVEQYLEDLDIVIDSLCSRYDKEKVNLIGTSWGGMYGLLYLMENDHKITAYACIDGKADSHYQNHSLIDYELALIEDMVDSSVSERQKELTEMKDELLKIKNSNFESFHTEVNRIKHVFPPKLGFNAYFVDTSKIISLEDVLKDSALLKLMNYTEEEYMLTGEKAEIVNEAFRNTPSYNNMDIKEDLNNISIPVAVVQGEKDFVVGPEQAFIIYNALTGIEKDEKELHIIPGVGHCPAIESPVKLLSILNNFFVRYNGLD